MVKTKLEMNLLKINLLGQMEHKKMQGLQTLMNKKNGNWKMAELVLIICLFWRS